MNVNIEGEKKSVLLLCNYGSNTASTIIDYIGAFKQYSKNDIYELNMFGDFPLNLVLHNFDVIIIHYSICIGKGGYLSYASKKQIKDFTGLKVLIIQDEHRWINITTANMVYMGIGVVFSLVSKKDIPFVYPSEVVGAIRFERILTGYVADRMLQTKLIDYKDRTIDVSYRARKLSFWMGAHTLQKWEIAEIFQRNAANCNLTLDISIDENQRLYGEAWENLLRNSRAVLGTESGISVCDFTGEIQKKVDQYCCENPEASFDELRDMFFKDEDGKIIMNVIAPRIFEAISFKALLILFEGDYEGILTPWRHYVPLERNGANFKEVIEILSSVSRASEIIEQAYNEVLCNPKYHYKTLIHCVDRVIDEETVHAECKVKRTSINKRVWTYRFLRKILKNGKKIFRKIKILNMIHSIQNILKSILLLILHLVYAPLKKIGHCIADIKNLIPLINISYNSGFSFAVKELLDINGSPSYVLCVGFETKKNSCSLISLILKLTKNKFPTPQKNFILECNALVKDFLNSEPKVFFPMKYELSSLQLNVLKFLA
jgi:hypothetical protein